jgi:hypothetical protein
VQSDLTACHPWLEPPSPKRREPDFQTPRHHVAPLIHASRIGIADVVVLHTRVFVLVLTANFLLGMGRNRR